jgi:hypothetical protein
MLYLEDLVSAHCYQGGIMWCCMGGEAVRGSSVRSHCHKMSSSFLGKCTCGSDLACGFGLVQYRSLGAGQ